jgi:hypothetical protein
MERALVCSQTSKYLTFVFLPTGTIFSQKLNVFIIDDWSSFAVLQSRIHGSWAAFFGSTLEDRPVYTPTDCFETFPFPKDFRALPICEETGREYYEFRAALAVKNNEGLTTTYNRFHDPEEDHADILRLRELHAAMDRAVLDAYGWTDIHPNCKFILDYEAEEDEEENGPRRRKKPWRYRWPDEIRDEVLARLLDLNRQRAIEEGQLPSETPAFGQPALEKPNRKGRKKQADLAQIQTRTGKLFSTEKGEV